MGAIACASTHLLHMTIQTTIDYLAFTFHSTDISLLLDSIGYSYSDFTMLPKGGLGYLKCMTRKGIRVYYCGRDDMGVHVDISSQGLADFYSHVYDGMISYNEFNTFFFDILESQEKLGISYSEEDVKIISILRYLTSIGCTYTRVDYAMDDYGYLYTRPALDDVMSTGDYKCKAHTVSKYEGLKGSHGVTYGFGSRTSKTYVRVYDKLEERKDRNKPVPDGVTTWIRYEIEIKGDYADKAINEMLSIRLHTLGILKTYVSIGPKWDSFFGSIDKVSCYVPHGESTMSQKMAWLERSVSKSLVSLMSTTGGDYRVVDHLVDYAYKHHDMTNVIMHLDAFDFDRYISLDKLDMSAWATTSRPASV